VSRWWGELLKVLGIDEAGRGCVLGALVIGAFLAEVDSEAILIAAGAADSKKLSAKRRIAARAALVGVGEGFTVEISAKQIDNGNLNTLEEEAIVALVVAHRPDQVIVDALGHPSTLPKVVARLDAAVRAAGVVVAWKMEPKADQNYPVVGAASIFAKTTRDGALEQLKATHGDFGSGYPSDPKTRNWLAEIAKEGGEWPFFVRTRWGTVRDLTEG
jgi:ribonuclease HII